MKFVKSFFLVVSLCYSSFVLADQEPWYAYWGLGTGSYHYPANVSVNYDTVGDSSRSAYTIDSWGFYWPLNENTLLGFILTDTFDTAKVMTSGSGVAYEKEQGVYSISAMKYFGHSVGDGWFVRGDLGLVSVITRDTNFDTGEPWEETGTGVLLGAGYGYPVSSGTHILFSLQASHNQVGDGVYRSLRAIVGVLW